MPDWMNALMSSSGGAVAGGIGIWVMLAGRVKALEDKMSASEKDASQAAIAVATMQARVHNQEKGLESLRDHFDTRFDKLEAKLERISAAQ